MITRESQSEGRGREGKIRERREEESNESNARAAAFLAGRSAHRAGYRDCSGLQNRERAGRRRRLEERVSGWFIESLPARRIARRKARRGVYIAFRRRSLI